MQPKNPMTTRQAPRCVEPRPCPTCGKKPEFVPSEMPEFPFKLEHLGNGRCFGATVYRTTEDDAIDEWNDHVALTLDRGHRRRDRRGRFA